MFGMGTGLMGAIRRSGGYTPVHALDVVGFDFSRNTARVNGVSGSAASFLTTTRASTGYVLNSAGVYLPFSANIPRITDLGLLVEEARTNSVRNSAAAGYVAGVVGAGGAPPTNWQLPAGLPVTVVGGGVDGGRDYVDLRFSGTPGTTGPQVLRFDTSVAATAGQTWTNSVWASLIAGSLANLSNISLRAGDEAGGTSFALPGTPVRVQNIRTLGATNAVATLRWNYLDTVSPVDFTMRLSWPQCELGGHASSPIRTTASASTRDADIVSVVISGLGSEFSLYSAGASDAAVSAAIGEISDGSTSNRAALLRDAGVRRFVVAAGATTLDATAGSWPSSAQKCALALAASNIRSAAGGALLGASADAVGIPAGAGMTRLGIGSLALGASAFFEGYISRVAIINKRLTDAELQDLTT